ncbi:uncharacterized protein LOC121375747 isoform X2 [Gigantopelta aegis]|nr:uncharacterized protein LOC121375747 isoform X2 [Gigantopelta aegis]
MLTKNSTLLSLDISSNRINPPAVMELMRGLTKNKVLQHLKLGHNPITASFSSVMLEAIKKSPHVALQSLDLEGIVVDKEFESLMNDINTSRHLEVTYEISLPIAKKSRDKMLKELELPQSFNIDPLRMLHLLKEKNRAQDFFRKINKDDDDGLTRDELSLLFKEAGIPVTVSVIDKIMEFMDTNGDGTIDMAEFLIGDRKITKISRNQDQSAQSLRKRDAHYIKYSRTFRKAHIDPKNFSLKVEESNNRLSPIDTKPSDLRALQWEQTPLNK